MGRDIKLMSSLQLPKGLTSTSCLSCGASLSLTNRIWGAINAASSERCDVCASHWKAALDHFRADFVQACSGGVLTPSQWHPMWERLRASPGASKTTWREDALNFIQNEAHRFLTQIISTAYADGLISSEEDDYFDKMVRAVLVDEARATPFRARWAELKRCSEVRQGRLPTIATTLHLESGELCHFQQSAQYAKNTAKGTVIVAGQLIATSKRIHFLASDASGWTIQYDRVLRISAQNGLLGQGALTLELSTKKGAGTYHLSQVDWAEVVFSTLIRINKRHLISPDKGASHHIPQDVKIAVWQRDGGRCVECQASDYLEFDHIIPHSKGGASTLANVQLLCRRCNGKKSDRI